MPDGVTISQSNSPSQRFGMLAQIVSPAEFFSPENLQRIMAGSKTVIEFQRQNLKQITASI